jgi:CDP-diacylglycerol--serine O-phosphatidyltransferase
MKNLKRGVFLLPNILTTFGLFAGFYAIILAISGEFITSSIAIFIAMLWDGLDGRVARMTNTQSSFGEQYDSMADLISFGVAPSFLIYFYLQSLGQDFGNLPQIASFIYITTAALRLARFNSQIEIIDKKYFQGLPSPASAALVAGFIWLSDIFSFDSYTQSIVALLVLIFSGVLMVSNIRYYSFKDLNLKSRSSFKKLLILVSIIIGVWIYPSIVLFGFFAIYAISGIVWTLNEIAKKRDKKVKKSPGNNSPAKKI